MGVVLHELASEAMDKFVWAPFTVESLLGRRDYLHASIAVPHDLLGCGSDSGSGHYRLVFTG